MPISAIDAISPAFQHTKQQIFQPFRAGQWARLALVGLLAGELTTGSCNGFNTNLQVPRHPNQFVASPFPNIDPALLVLLVALLLVLGFVFWILLLYISSVMRFILFDSVIARNCEIRRGWNRRQGPGLRYFLWQILFGLAMFVGFVILIGIPAAFAFAAGWLTKPKEHLAPLILFGMALFLAVLAFGVLAAVVHVFTKDFVIPQMAIENISAFQAWARLLPMLGSEKGPYFGYVLMKIVMALGVGIVVGIITTVVILVTLIPIGGLGALFVFAGKAAGFSWNLYTITLAVVVGCLVLAAILYVVSIVSVPAMVFFPAYSIYFFASRYPALDALIHPAPPLPPSVPYPAPTT
ncbi:MAG TPA: hypothetical protein VEG68_04270 [Terriglobales bacterium]|nr:hypothetical protein [Terriglobales bacterium]